MCKKCIVCGNDLTGPSQRKFCSSRCAAIYNNNKRKERNYSTKGRTKIVQCIRCGCNIDVSIHSSRKSWICNECKQNNSPHSKNVEKIKSILEFSKRTAVKILKRMGAKCSICGWDESTCDIHHIIAVRIFPLHKQRNQCFPLIYKMVSLSDISLNIFEYCLYRKYPYLYE